MLQGVLSQGLCIHTAADTSLYWSLTLAYTLFHTHFITLSLFLYVSFSSAPFPSSVTFYLSFCLPLWFVLSVPPFLNLWFLRVSLMRAFIITLREMLKHSLPWLWTFEKRKFSAKLQYFKQIKNIACCWGMELFTDISRRASKSEASLNFRLKFVLLVARVTRTKFK